MARLTGQDAELEELLTSEPTGIGYLQIAGAADGRMPEAEHLKRLPDGARELENGQVLLSQLPRRGRPACHSCVVAGIEPGERLTCSSNYFVLSADEDKVLPEYLQMFFDSALGSSQLLSAARGANVLHLSKHELMQVTVPLPPLAVQRGLVERRRELMERVAYFEHAIERTKEEMDEAWEEALWGAAPTSKS